MDRLLKESAGYVQETQTDKAENSTHLYSIYLHKTPFVIFFILASSTSKPRVCNQFYFTLSTKVRVTFVNSRVEFRFFRFSVTRVLTFKTEYCNYPLNRFWLLLGDSDENP